MPNNRVDIQWTHWSLISGKDKDTLELEVALIPCFECYVMANVIRGTIPTIYVLRGSALDRPEQVYFGFASVAGERCDLTVIDAVAGVKYCHMETPNPIREFELGRTCASLALNNKEGLAGEELNTYKRVFSSTRQHKYHVIEPELEPGTAPAQATAPELDPPFLSRHLIDPHPN